MKFLFWLTLGFPGVLGETVATKTCSCDKSPGVQCYYDPSCPGLGCGAEGQAHCRFCGPKNGYAACPDKEAKSKPEREEANATTAKQVAEVKPEEEKSKDTKKVQDDHKDAKAVTSKKEPKPSGSDETKKEKMAEAKVETKKPTKAEPKEAKKSESKTADELAESKSAKAACPCLHSKSLRCFYDESCPGLGCGAHGLKNCRFCGDKNGTYHQCPDESPVEVLAEKPKATGDDLPCASCLHSDTLRCFHDESCPGLGCGAHGLKNCRFCGDEDGKFHKCPELKPKPVIVSTRKADSLLLFPTSEEKAQKEAEVAEASKASLRLASDNACPCQNSDKMRCFYDDTCPGLGCGAEGYQNCRYCGDKGGQFHACPDPDAKPGKVKPTKPKPSVDPMEVKPVKEVKFDEKDASDAPCASCLHSTLKCFYDPSCPGVGCGANGHQNCRFCGDKDGQFAACPDPNAKPPKNGVVAANTPGSKLDPAMNDDVLEHPQDFDVYRCMAAAAVDTHPMEDDDIADLAGAVKYVHTEILTEHLQSPIRQTRKYAIDAVTRHRMKFKNPSTVQGTTHALQGEFSQFVTYDFGQATNPAQLPVIQEQGDFVGIAPCTDLHCDVRFPASRPYSWLSCGNWCSNLPWDKKGTKTDPNPHCLKNADGEFIQGGLCPNGFNPDSFLPGAAPTGEQGCVYTYGKASFVKLDDVVGITSEYCGEKLCKNWLDFRENCTERHKYQRQFRPDGSIKSTNYCVEFDIHPACEASCEAPPCVEFLSQGGNAYLGLPFWHGRCDPRANQRRVETVAFALALPGALTNHLLIDPQMLQRACPASEGSSWSCVPLAASNFAGPYCTRSYNGACDRCFIPGVAGGPIEVQHPWCPTDILESATYKDLGIQLTCDSNAASKHCCLYTQTCDGHSDPATAALTDDGLALVASRKNTDEMKQFLTRAASAHHRYQNLDFQDQKMHWAAYFAWDLAPLDRTLEEALAEMEKYLTSEHYVVNLYTTTTTTTATTVVVGGPSKLPASLACAARSVSFAPIDMPGTMAITASLEECQKKCAKTSGCFHFSLLEAVSSCHLHSFSALAQENSLGWISGPAECWQGKKAKEKGLLIDKGHDTYVSLAFACMSWGSSFSPALPGAYSTLEEKDFKSEIEATLECQKRCKDHKECKHFTVSFPLRSCILAGKDAMSMSGIAGSISGPPKCDNKAMQSYYWQVLPQSDQPQWQASSTIVSFLLMGVVALAVVVSFVMWRRPACSVRSIHQHPDVDTEQAFLEWHQTPNAVMRDDLELACME